MGLAGPDTLLVGLRKSVKFDLKEEDESRRQGDVGPPRHLAESPGTGRARSAPRCPRPGPCRPYIPMDGHALPGQGRRLALQAGSARQKVPTILLTRAGWVRTASPSARSSIEKIDASEIKLVYSNVKLNAQSGSRSSPSRRPPTRPSRTTPRPSSRASTRRSRFKHAKRAEAAKRKDRARPAHRHPQSRRSDTQIGPVEPDFRTHIPGDQRVDSRRLSPRMRKVDQVYPESKHWRRRDQRSCVGVRLITVWLA